jgi:hypothetical protein
MRFEAERGRAEVGGVDVGVLCVHINYVHMIRRGGRRRYGHVVCTL